MNGLTTRDEREATVDRAADRLAYLVLSFGLLAIVAYRSFAGHEASWDLLGLVILGGAVGTLYRVQQHVASRSWVTIVGLSAVVAVVLAAILAFAGRG